MRRSLRRVVAGLLIPILLGGTGCVTSLSMSEEMTWGKLLNDGVVREPIPFKSKTTAGVSSFIVPGAGHFYTGESGLGVAYFLGNILWPINILWTVPAGMQSATITNKRRTVEYYKFGSHADKVAKLRQKRKLPADFKGYEEVKVQ